MPRRYPLALLCVFLLGCAAALGLRALDARYDRVAPLAGGETFALPGAGVTLRAPQGFTLTLAPTGETEVYLLSDGERTVQFARLPNGDGDDILSHGEGELIAAAVRAGYESARMRTLGGRRFLCCEARGEDGGLLYRYQTWDADAQLLVLTAMPYREALPILQTLAFSDD